MTEDERKEAIAQAFMSKIQALDASMLKLITDSLPDGFPVEEIYTPLFLENNPKTPT